MQYLMTQNANNNQTVQPVSLEPESKRTHRRRCNQLNEDFKDHVPMEIDTPKRFKKSEPTWEDLYIKVNDVDENILCDVCQDDEVDEEEKD